MSVGGTRVFDAADAFLKSLLIKFKTILRFRSAHSAVVVVAVVLSSRIHSTINHNSLYTPNVSRKRARMNGSVSVFFFLLPSPSLPQPLPLARLPFTLFMYASATRRGNFVEFDTNDVEEVEKKQLYVFSPLVRSTVRLPFVR